MTVTVAQLGARALRKLGLGIVANADRQPDGIAYTQADVVGRVLTNLGITVPANRRPASLGTVTQAELGRRVLRSLGVNPVADAPDLGTTISQDEIAARALRSLGANAIQFLPVSNATISQREIAIRALRSLGVNPVADPVNAAEIITPLEITTRALRTLGVDPADFQAAGTGFIRSIDDVVLDALKRLEVIAADETPAASDLDYGRSRARSAHDMLVALDYANWAPDSIPNSVFEAYVALTANLLAPGYGKEATDETAAAAREMVRVQALSGIIARDRTLLRVSTIHDSIASEGLSDWNISQIPSEVGEAYVTLVVAALAPMYGKQVDPQSSATAMAMIRRIVLSGTRGQALAMDRVQSVHDAVVGEALANWALTNLPDAVSEAYVKLTSAALAPVYGQKVDPQEASLAFAAIRRFVLSGPRAQAIASAKVQSVHDAVVAEGLADWDVASIPDAVGEAYVGLTVAALGPVYDKEIDPQASAGALATIRRVVLSGSRAQAIAVAKVRSVHDGLVAQRIAGWDVNSVPVAYAEDYVTAGVALLAPVYGQKVEGPVFESVVARIRGAEHIKDVETTIGQKVAAFQSELNALGLVSWAPDAIPGAVVDAYATAATVLLEIEDKKLDPKAMDDAMQRVRRVAMTGPAGQALAEQKVRAVHYDLEARGKARWTLLDVPRYAEEPYVLLTAVLLAPEVGERADPSWGPGAEMALARVTSLPSAGRPVVAAYF